MRGTRSTLTSGSSGAAASAIAGAASGVNDHDASVTAWQDAHPHEKPFSLDDSGSTEIGAAACPTSAAAPGVGAWDRAGGAPSSEAQSMPTPLRPRAASSNGS